ncbi:MAG TPA: tripartite tricarboxylate transporter substrate-binding protein [Thermodesulfobacteriota bacterium]
MSKGIGRGYRALAWGVGMALGLLVATAEASAARVLDTLRIVAPAAPGGGYDRTARAMQQAIEEARLARKVQVINVPGAAGAIGLAQFIKNDRGRGDALIVGGFGMVASFLTSKSVVTLKDVTPVARLTGEFLLVVVPEASRFRTLADLTAALKADPGAVSIAGGPAGGTDHIAAALLAEAVGVGGNRVNYVAFSGGSGDSIASLVGNQVSAGFGGYSELIGHVRAGKLRALGITAEARVPGLDIPTLREQGIDVTLVNWRGVSAPPDLEPRQRQAYLDLVDRMVKSDAWKAELAKNGWSDQYLSGDRFVEYLDAEQARVEKVLRGLGLLK